MQIWLHVGYRQEIIAVIRNFEPRRKKINTLKDWSTSALVASHQWHAVPARCAIPVIVQSKSQANQSLSSG